MSTLISLNEVPQNLLYPAKWIELRAFASSDLMSLTLINAPYPDRDYPRDFFWGRDGSYEQAIRCYTIGRELLDQCRQLLIGRELTAIGTRPDGTRKMITSIEWTNTWPMFATNRATGPNSSYDDVEIVESSPLETPDERMLLDTVGWLRLQSPATLEQKKLGLLYNICLEYDPSQVVTQTRTECCCQPVAVLFVNLSPDRSQLRTGSADTFVMFRIDAFERNLVPLVCKNSTRRANSLESYQLIGRRF